MSEKKIVAKCLSDDGDHFVCAEGYWLPCCTITDQYKEYFLNEDFNALTGKDFHLKDKFLLWADYYLSEYDTAPGGCKKKCGVLGHMSYNEFYHSGDDAEYF